MSPAREQERSFAPPVLAEDAHKGNAGRLLSLCGSRTMPGAALLVARAAQRAGAGLVSVGCLHESLMALVPAVAPEAVLVDLTRKGDASFVISGGGHDAIVAGPGLGDGQSARDLVHRLVSTPFPGPLALDADALNLLQERPEHLRDRRGPVVITPHPGEAARLLGREVPRDDEGRVAAARELHQKTGAVVCLKGARTVVTEGSLVYVNDTGNPGMATAGAGDVLAGVVGAYLAQCGTGEHPEWTPFDAACAAVRVHGLAGDLAVRHLGRRALIASDLIGWLAGAQQRLET